jgi:hypothetical protein
MEFNSIMRIFACISLIIGAVECFAGFKIMKAMLIIWGFFIGAIIGVAVWGVSNSIALGVILVLLVGIGFAMLSYKLYLVGIFMLIASLTAVTMVYLISATIWIALMLAVPLGILAVCFVKPVVIITTSISGAGIILSSAYVMMNLGLNVNYVVTVFLWIPIALAGIACQCITTENTTTAKSGVKLQMQPSNQSSTFSERKYPGIQRAYRNFCIKCGCELLGTSETCPRCGFSFEDHKE